jgi:hypothetical protein
MALPKTVSAWNWSKPPLFYFLQDPRSTEGRHKFTKIVSLTYKIFLCLLFPFVFWRLADCLGIKYFDLGDVFNNGCDLIFALSTAVLTESLLFRGFCGIKVPCSAQRKIAFTRICAKRVMSVCVLICNIIFYERSEVLKKVKKVFF